MLQRNQLAFISQSMDLSNQPYPIRSFLGKLKFFTAFNVVFCLWALAQTIYYSVITSSISCSGMKQLFIIWTCSYAIEVIVPIACILIVQNSKYYRGGMVLAGLVALYKLGVVISVMAVAWRHVGLCYIDYGMRVIIIVTNVLQIICLTVEMLLLWRIKKVHRDVLLNNLIQKKTFAQN